MPNKKPGIYKITNTITNESYIGKSSNIERRFESHKQDLEDGTHHNKGLQEDYDLAKSLNPDYEIFTYDVIKEIQDEKDLNKEEMYWINEYNTFERGYNRTLGGMHDETKGYVDYGGGRLFSDEKRIQLIQNEISGPNIDFKYDDRETFKINLFEGFNTVKQPENDEELYNEDWEINKRIFKAVDSIEQSDFDEEKIEECMEIFKEIIEKDPRKAMVAAYNLKSCQRSAEIRLDLLNYAIDLAPDEEELKLAKIYCFEANGEYEKALEYSEKNNLLFEGYFCPNCDYKNSIKYYPDSNWNFFCSKCKTKLEETSGESYEYINEHKAIALNYFTIKEDASYYFDVETDDGDVESTVSEVVEVRQYNKNLLFPIEYKITPIRVLSKKRPDIIDLLANSHVQIVLKSKKPFKYSNLVFKKLQDNEEKRIFEEELRAIDMEKMSDGGESIEFPFEEKNEEILNEKLSDEEPLTQEEKANNDRDEKSKPKNKGVIYNKIKKAINLDTICLMVFGILFILFLYFVSSGAETIIDRISMIGAILLLVAIGLICCRITDN